MNKIVVVDDKTKDIKLSDNIEFHIETYDTLFSITNVGIEVKNDESLFLFISSNDKKYRVNIDIAKDTHANLYIFEKVIDSKVQYSFTLGENANVLIKHFNKNSLSKQMIEANLIGTDCCFNYEIRKICNNKDTIDFYIHHCGEGSISKLGGAIISLANSAINAQLSTFVEEECNNANSFQQLNLLKMGGAKTEIKPNLYIDNNTATINHNNNISVIDDFIESDFMINDIYDKNLKEEIIIFLDRIGGLENE